VIHDKKIIFVSWTSYARHSDLLGQALGGEVYFIEDLIKSRGLIWKMFFIVDYLSKAIRSLKIISQKRPKYVFVQNPPSVAPVALVLFRRIMGFKLVVDSHNGAFEEPWISVPLHKWSLSQADLVVVHNRQILKNIKDSRQFENVNFQVLNSRLPEFPGVPRSEQSHPYILVISTFASDEPMEELLSGISLFIETHGKGVGFKITGNYRKSSDLYEKYSGKKGVEFLGYVDEEEYKSILVNAHGIIALSTRDDVQQFALMEAIGAGVPFISTDNITNRALFNDHMVLTKNISEDIEKSIDMFLINRDAYKRNVENIKATQSERWQKDFDMLVNSLS